MSSLFESVYVVQEITEECTALSPQEFTSFIMLIKHLRDLYVCDPQPFSFKFGLKSTVETNYYLVNFQEYTMGVKSRIPEIKFTVDPNCIDEDTYYYTKKGDNFISGYLLAIWLSKQWIQNILPKEYYDVLKIKHPEELISDQFPTFEEFFDTIKDKLKGVVYTTPVYPSIQQYPKENIIFDMINPNDIIKLIDSLPQVYNLTSEDINMINELCNIVSQMVKYVLQQKKGDKHKDLFKCLFKLRYTFAEIFEYQFMVNTDQTGGLHQFRKIRENPGVFNLIDKIILQRGRNISSELYSTLKQEVTTVLSTDDNDLEIFKGLNSISKKIPIDSDFNRGKQRVRDLKDIGFFSKVKSANTLLDFGGQNGIIGREIGDVLNTQNVIVTDISNWFGNTFTKVPNVKQIFLNTYTLNQIDTQSIDLIICFQVLHHIKQFETTLNELYRVLKPGGYMLIREHDCNSEETRVLIDIEHSLFECAIESRGYKYLKEYYANYFTRKNLNMIIEKHGFISNTVNSDPSTGNDTRYYYQLYSRN